MTMAFSVFKKLLLIFLLTCPFSVYATGGVRIKDLGRIDGVRENSLVGYGIVSGLAGTGDSSRSKVTLQSVTNILSQFGVKVNVDDLSSRNVAAVMVTTRLPAFSRPGDKLDVNVTSMGDARSLSGGTLLLTPVYGPNSKIYALAQGVLAVGGYQYDMNGNSVQKNHPTSAIISEGAIVETSAVTEIIQGDYMNVVLSNPDYTTAQRVAETLNSQIGPSVAMAVDAGRVKVHITEAQKGNIVEYVAKIENIVVAPDQRAKIVINERNGTIVSGGDVKISKVTVSHGNLKVSIATEYLVSQPGYLIEPGDGIRTEVVPRSQVYVKESGANTVTLASGATVSDLVIALSSVKTSTRDVITILQGIKQAGALHAELIIQ